MYNKPLFYIGGGLIILVLVILVTLFGNSIGPFRLISTTPKSGSQTNQYAAISFKFNRPLDASPNTNRISLLPSVPGQLAVSGDTVTFTPTTPYRTDRPYKATLSAIVNAKGEKLADITINFSPVYLPENQLPTDVQQRLLAQTNASDKAPKPYLPGSIAISGSSELVNRGLSSQQLIALKQALYLYFQKANLQVRGVEAKNIVKTLHDPNADGNGSLEFSATFDNKTAVNAKIVLMNLTAIQLLLYEPTGNALIYDSGLIDTTTQGVD